MQICGHKYLLSTLMIASTVFSLLSSQSAVGRAELVHRRQQAPDSQSTAIEKAKEEVTWALFAASYEGRMESVRECLERGADVNGRDSNQATPLLLAAPRWPKIVRLLIGHGANVDAQDDRGNTALIQAVGNAQSTSVRCLLAHGANVDLADNQGDTVLHRAVDPHYYEAFGDLGKTYAHHPDPTTISWLLAAHPNLEAKNKEGYTPLMLALERNKLGVAAQLKAAGAQTTGTANAALIGAIIRHDTKAVRRLLDTGADANAKSQYGSPALNQAACYDNIDAARLLLARGARLDAQDNDQVTALMNSSRTPAVMRLLLDHGATITPNAEGMNPAFYAIESGIKSSCMQMLLDKGVAPDTEFEGKTLLMLAAEKGNAPVVKLLLARGADPKRSDTASRTPLHFLAEHFTYAPEATTVLKALFAAGADPNARDKSGRTPLFTLISQIEAPQGDAQIPKWVRSREIACVKLLLQAGTDVNARVPENTAIYDQSLTVLGLLKNSKQAEIISLLEKAGAKP